MAVSACGISNSSGDQNFAFILLGMWMLSIWAVYVVELHGTKLMLFMAV